MDRRESAERVKQFAHRCVKLALALPDGPLGRHICGQLIRCSTGAAADYRAACVAQSKAAWVAKLGIVIEETDESCFWMEFSLDEDLLLRKRVAPLLAEGEELRSMFIAARHTTQRSRKS